MFGRFRNKRRKRISSRNTAASRRTTGMPKTLPKSVVFNEIDYEGEHVDLAIPIVATVMLDDDGDVLIFNDEVLVHGSGPTLEDAMDDFCASFIVCYDIMLKYGPGNNRWKPIMHHLGYAHGE